MPRSSSVTRTVRLDEEVDRAVKEYAEREGISVSQIVNRSLRKFVEWDTYASRFGFVAIPSSLHTKMFNYLSDDEAREAGAWAGHNFARDFTIFRFGKMTLETVLQTLELLGSDYAGVFQFQHETDGRNHTLVLKHGRGAKASIFNAEFLKTVFEELLSRHLTIEQTEGQVIARVSP